MSKKYKYSLKINSKLIITSNGKAKKKNKIKVIFKQDHGGLLQ